METDTVAGPDIELLQMATGLIREYTAVPPGAVLRCVARATRQARMWGCPSQYLVSTVEASTRWCLAQRGAVPAMA